MAERGESESHAAGGTVCFPDSPRTLPGSRSEIGGRRQVSIRTSLRMPLALEARVRPAHFTFRCWQRLSESNAHDPKRIIVGFKPTKHATCEPLNWRRADHSKAMPHSGTHRLATACRTLPASLSVIGARLRTCTSRIPLTRRAHRYLCVTG